MTIELSFAFAECIPAHEMGGFIVTQNPEREPASLGLLVHREGTGTCFEIMASDFEIDCIWVRVKCLCLVLYLAVYF